MGFLGSLFGNKKEKEIELLRAEFQTLKSELSKNTLGVKSDVDQIITILSNFDEDINLLKRHLKKEKNFDEPYKHIEKIINGLVGINFKNEKSMEDIKKRMDNIEKLGEGLKIMGKLTLENYDSMKSAAAKLKKIEKLEALEKTLREHISLTPETVVSKDEYDEEMNSLKERLEDLEKNETILIGAERKRAKSSKAAGR